MTRNRSETIEAMRQRYLHEYRYIRKKGDRIAVMEEIGEMAAAADASAWKKFADGTSAGLREDLEGALALFEEAIALDPEFSYPWYGKGVILRAQKRYDEAMAVYDKSIALDLEYAYPWYGKGNVLLEQNRYDEALAAYDKSISLDPEYAYPWYGKGVVLRTQKRYDEAMAAYDKSIALDPEYAYPWNGKGNVLLDQKRYDEALAAYDKAIALDPEYAYPWNGKGSVLLHDTKRYDEALAAYDKAIALDPEYASPYYGLGLLRWRQGRPGESAEAFRRAIELGLESTWEEAAKSWIERAERMVKSEEAGEPKEEREQADRSSDEALITDLFEAMKDDLPAIRKKKMEFEKQIAKTVGVSRIIGEGGADDMLVVLRDWNSFSPILRQELRGRGGPGPDERLGGGYFLAWKGHGIVIDPGVDFVTQLYRKGLSIADVDTVIITHCHLDHTRDVESLVDLNYRYNKSKGFKPHPPNKNFRQLQFCLCDPAYTKYSEYLKNSGCCHRPKMIRGGDTDDTTDFIRIQAVHTQHKDITGRDDEAIGLVFLLKDESGLVLRVGITSDSKWIESLTESFSSCDVMVTHLGTIEVGEEKAATAGKGEKAVDTGKDVDTGGFLKTDLKNHLGTKGCFRLLQRVKPKVFIIGEVGEELAETRFKILQVFNRLKPDETQFVLGGDSNLAIGLGKKLSVCCSHSECAQSWTRIPLDQVSPVLGGDFLFQYICSQHGIVE